MSRFSESTFPDRAESAGFLPRLGITLVLLTAGIGLAVLIAAA
jgi:hypothetical protein